MERTTSDRIVSPALRRIAAAAVVVVLAGACASKSDLPTASLAVARTSIQHAEADNAPQLAPIEYQNARDKLARADAAAHDKRYVEARALADEAAADADVAERKARAIKASRAAADLQRSNSLLGSELNRTTQTTTQTVETPVPGTDVTRRTETTTTVTTRP